MQLLFLSLTLIVLAGCQSEQTVGLAPCRAGHAMIAGKNLSPRSVPIGEGGELRQTETVKVYGVNRYIDTADSRLMHERHAVYRLEQQPTWITRSLACVNRSTRPNRCLEKPLGKFSRLGAESRKRMKG
jgi:hypothetical protein